MANSSPSSPILIDLVQAQIVVTEKMERQDQPARRKILHHRIDKFLFVWTQINTHLTTQHDETLRVFHQHHSSPLSPSCSSPSVLLLVVLLVVFPSCYDQERTKNGDTVRSEEIAVRMGESLLLR